MAKNVFVLERELGFFITEDYPLMKFFKQLELLEEFEKEKEKHLKKSKKKGRLK